MKQLKILSRPITVREWTTKSVTGGRIRRNPRADALRLACFVVHAFFGAAVLSLQAACNAEPPVTVDDTWRVRPGSQELLEQAQSSIEKIQSRTDRLAARTTKGEDLKGKSDSLRKEIIEIYR